MDLLKTQNAQAPPFLNILVNPFVSLTVLIVAGMYIFSVAQQSPCGVEWDRELFSRRRD